MVWFDGEQIRSKAPDSTYTPSIYVNRNPLWQGAVQHRDQAVRDNHPMMQQHSETHPPPVSHHQPIVNLQQQQPHIQQPHPNPPQPFINCMLSINSAPETASTLSSMCTTLLQQLSFTAINYFTLISKTCISVIILFFSSSGQFMC
jgi:hypothetical protein